MLPSGIFWNDQGTVYANAKTESRTLVSGEKGQPLSSQAPGTGEPRVRGNCRKS